MNYYLIDRATGNWELIRASESLHESSLEEPIIAEMCLHDFRGQALWALTKLAPYSIRAMARCTFEQAEKVQKAADTALNERIRQEVENSTKRCVKQVIVDLHMVLQSKNLKKELSKYLEFLVKSWKL